MVGRWRSCVAPIGRFRVDRPVCAAASRASSARGHAVEQAVGDLALGEQRQASGAPSAARIVTRFVSVPNPEPASATSLATSRSTPLRAELVRRRARASRSRPRTRRGRARAAAAPGRRPVSAARTGDLGEDVRRRLELEGQPVAARELRSAAPGRPEVGDGGGHDQRVEAGARRPSRWRATAARARISAVDSTRTTLASARQRHLDVGRR